MTIEFKISELAAEFGVHRNTIRNWLRSGQLKAKQGPGKRLLFAREDYLALCRKFGRAPRSAHRTGTGEEPPRPGPLPVLEEIPVQLDGHAVAGTLSGMKLSTCQTCGSCVSACPISGVDGLDPRKIVRMALLGLNEELALTDWPWKCTFCGACEITCPMEIPIVQLMRRLRAGRRPDEMPGTIQRGVVTCLEQGNNLGIRKEELLHLFQVLGDELAAEGFPGFRVPVDRRGARLLVTINSKEPFAEPQTLKHWWKIFHAAGESWTVPSENWEGVNWGLYSGDDHTMHTMVGRIVENLERLDCSALLLPDCGHAYYATRWGLATWYPEANRRFRIYSVFDLLLEYLREGRIQLNQEAHQELSTYHDGCNYSRKSLAAFGTGYFDEPRILTRACCRNFTEMEPDGALSHCCGAGGGPWASPYVVERVFNGRLKARQIKESRAKLVVVSCHTCRDQIRHILNREFELGVQVKYLWELVADSMIRTTQPGSVEAIPA